MCHFHDNQLFLWLASQKRKPWGRIVDASFMRKGQGAVNWVNVLPTQIKTYRLITKPKRKSLHAIKGSWEGHKISVRTSKNLKTFDLLIPNWYKPTKEDKLKVYVNGKLWLHKHVNGWNLKDYLTEIAHNKDRWTPLRQVVRIKY